MNVSTKCVTEFQLKFNYLLTPFCNVKNKIVDFINDSQEIELNSKYDNDNKMLVKNKKYNIIFLLNKIENVAITCFADMNNIEGKFIVVCPHAIDRFKLRFRGLVSDCKNDIDIKNKIQKIFIYSKQITDIDDLLRIKSQNDIDDRSEFYFHGTYRLVFVVANNVLKTVFCDTNNFIRNT